MGGLPWDVAARDLPVPEAISQRRAALGIPQATPRAQEAPPQAAKRGQGQACGDGQTAPDTQDQSTKRSKSVYNIISTQGWLAPPCGVPSTDNGPAQVSPQGESPPLALASRIGQLLPSLAPRGPHRIRHLTMRRGSVPMPLPN